MGIRGRTRVLRALLVVLCGPSVQAMPVSGQDGPASPAGEEVVGIRDVACPTTLRMGAFGTVYYWKDGSFFATGWENLRPAMGESLSDYRAIPDPSPLSTSGRHRWYEAGIRVRCFQYVYRDAAGGTRFSATILDSLEAFERGEVRPVGEECSPARAEEEWADPGYDPYDSGEGTATPGAEGCPDGGGGDTQPPDPGDPDGPVGWTTPTPGGGGTYFCPDSMPYYWDIGCIEEWVEGIGWVEWWCGPVLVCG